MIHQQFIFASSLKFSSTLVSEHEKKNTLHTPWMLLSVTHGIYGVILIEIGSKVCFKQKKKKKHTQFYNDW